MEVRGEDEKAIRMSASPSSPPLGEDRRDDEDAIFIAPPPPLDQLSLQSQTAERNGSDPYADPNTDPVLAPPPAPPLTMNGGARAVIRYRECQKNHAASMGGHVVDGCGEFMPRGDEGTSDAFRCAACNCHRNFHRKETEGSESLPGDPSVYYPYSHPNRNSNRRNHLILPAPAPPQFHPHHKYSHSLAHAPPVAPPMLPIPPVMVAFGGGGSAPADSSSEDLTATAAVAQQDRFAVVAAKKRHRTKFSQEQKDKMMEFAEKLGWKMQKQDEEQVDQFCGEVGVKRQVFKVWMHNNKQAMKKKQ